jgi:hypothetical protein
MATIWEMLAESVRQLDEPFRRSEIIGWFRRHHPEVMRRASPHTSGGGGRPQQGFVRLSFPLARASRPWPLSTVSLTTT